MSQQSTRGRTVAGYGEVLRDRLTGRLFAAGSVSAIGDFVGSGALIVLAFERSGGRAVGAAGFLAAGGLGAVFSAVLGGPLLDHVPRRAGLVGGELVGASALLLPLFLPGLWPLYAAAVVLGIRRSAEVSIRHGLLADAVPERLRGGFLAALGTTDQVGQVIGFLTGATLAVTLGARIALVGDLATFLLAAVLLAGLESRPRGPRDDQPSLTAGWTGIFRHRQLRLLCLLVAISAAASALPESLAPAAVGGDSPWLPLVLAAGPAGAALGFVVAGRVAATHRFTGQLVHLTGYGLVAMAGAVVSGPLGFGIVNVAVGAGSAWILGPQVSFLRLADPRRVAQIAATMAAVVMVAEGAWVVAMGAVADAAGVRTAYLLASLAVLAAAAVGWAVHARRGEDRDRFDAAAGLVARPDLEQAG